MSDRIDTPCSFDDSGGAFPNGYCLWQLGASGQDPVELECHCEEGYECGEGPPTDIDDRDSYVGEIIKFPCSLTTKEK